VKKNTKAEVGGSTQKTQQARAPRRLQRGETVKRYPYQKEGKIDSTIEKHVYSKSFTILIYPFIF
jgi:hypothetical protein